ncbi:MAG: MFS transporter [Lachnospiraceae bacterium]|nr:MFS transporter [Lachnospiraceae bacterium]
MNGKIFENPALKTRIKSSGVKIQEMAFGYLVAPFCAMISNAIFGSYLNRYYVDVLGWTKFGVFSTLLPMLSSILVIAGNILVGQWIDNTRTPAGKARPYLLLSIPMIAAAVLLMFMTPRNGSNGIQMLWIAVTYNLYYAIAYPCYYTAHSSMVSLSTRNANQRGLLATLSNASTVAAAGIGASIIVPILLQPFMFVAGEGGSIDVDASYANWRILAIALALLSAVGIIFEYYFTRERITEEAIALNLKEEKLPLKKHVDVCTKDKYWWMVIIFILVFQFGQLCKNSSMSFYARWMFDNVMNSANPESTSAAMMSTLGLVGGLPAAVGMVVAWPLANKLGKKRAMVLGLAFAAVGGLVAFLNVNSFPIVCVAVVLKGIGIVPAQYVMLALISDILDHLEAKNGFRSDGFTMSLYSSIMVGLGGLGMGIINAMLAFSGYVNTGYPVDPKTVTLIEDISTWTGDVIYRQMGGTEQVLAFVYLAVDVITFVISIALLWKLDVEKYGDEDRRLIIEHQKQAVLAEGGTWVDPEERARLEQEQADREAEEERIRELKAKCEKQGLNFEEEERKYQEAQEKRKNSFIGKLLG